MNIYEMTRKEIMELDYIAPATEFSGCVIVPTDETHDSGYQCMKFVLIDYDGEVVGCIGGGSDVIHLNGIGGYGKGKIYSTATRPVDWKIDCLKTGFLRLFSGKSLSTDGYVFSDFCIYANEKGENNGDF